MSDNHSYKVSIAGGGLTLEREVPQTIGDQIVMLILSGGASNSVSPPAPQVTARHDAPHRPVSPVAAASTAAPAATKPTPHHAHGGEPLSIREYLDETEAKRAPDKITSIGMYLATHREKTDFTKADLIEQFEGASEVVPRNLNRDLKWTLKAGWIAQRMGANGAYYVTNTGKSAIKEKFSKDVVQKTKGLTTYRPKKKDAKEDAS